MNRPSNIGELAPEIQYYILHLEGKIEELEEKAYLRSEDDSTVESSLKGLYDSLNFQLKRISEELRDSSISFGEKNDKKYDRFCKAMVDCKDVASNLLFLKKELKITDKKQEAEEVVKAVKKGNLIEKMAKENGDD